MIVLLCSLLVLVWGGVGVVYAEGPGYIEDQPGGALRLPPLEQSGAFSIRHWTVGDGLPRQEVLALAQTSDGYLWCGTADGLVRYDGRQFRTFFSNEVPALNGIVVSRLFCDRQGRLWISGFDGEVVVLCDGTFRCLETESGLPGGGGRAAVVSQSGDFWIHSGAQWFGRYDNERFARQLEGGLQGENNWWFSTGWADHDRLVWALMDGPLITAADGEKVLNRHLVRVDESGAYEEVGVLDPEGGPDDLQEFFHLADGTPALVSRDGFYVLGSEGWRVHLRFDLPLVKTHGAPRSVYQDEQGAFWVGTHYGGLVLCDKEGKTRHFRLPGESRRSDVHALLGDDQGSVWVATDGGLYQITRNFVRPLGGSGRATALVEDSNGMIWIARDESIVGLGEDDRVKVEHGFPPDYLIHGVEVDRMGRGRDGLVWVGLSRYRKETQKWEYELWKCSRDELIFVCQVTGRIEALFQPDNHPLLIGTRAGLWRWDGGDAVEEELDGMTGGTITSVCEDAAGGLFAAVLDEGLYQLVGGGWKKIAIPAGDGAEEIEGMTADPEAGIWAGCGARGMGLWREGRWSVVADAGGLPREVTGVIADRLGGLWVTSVTGEGVVRFERSAILAMLEGKGAVATGSRLGREDGLPSLVIQERRNPLVLDRKGRVLLVSRRGAAAIDPKERRRTEEEAWDSLTQIQTVLVNDVIVHDFIRSDFAIAGNLIEVDPGPRRVEFEYAAVHFGSQADTSYRYRLEGYDENWISADGKRSALYPYLPPGPYRFRVASRVGRSGWSESQSTVLLAIKPHWWERPMTKVLVTVVIVALIWMFFMMRLRRSNERSRMQAGFSRALIRSQEEERKRLAGELHDSLGHDLLVLKGSLEREARNIAGGISKRLLALSVKTADTVQQMRGISHALSPPGLERFGLGSALESLVCETEEATGIQMSIAIAEIGRLPAEVELGLFRIAQEALNNMGKHSDASEGRVALSRQGGTIVLVIEDDGRGFDPDLAVGNSGGLGLNGMDERARLLGGTMHAVSRKTKGARITILIPADPLDP